MIETRPISLTHLKAPGLAVGLGEALVLRAQGSEPALVAYGLGSCVALCLWVPLELVAGMAHVVLPGEDPTGTPNPRFARSALPALVSLMHAVGAARNPGNLVARLAGGAQVLTLDSVRGLPRIGDANALAMFEVLEEAGISVEAHDLGGSLGRSVWFDPRDGGQIRVRAIGSSERFV
jgi:chemotaxis protein CheD